VKQNARIKQRTTATLPVRRTKWLVAACVMLAALFCGRGVWRETQHNHSAAALLAAAHSTMPASRAIEQIRVGQRVIAGNPDMPDSESLSDTDVDPATWKLLRLHAEERWDDGTLDTIEMETLQPPEWISAQGAVVGKVVPLPIDVVEMGLPESIRATVVAVEPCPRIERGAGRVVLSTINHLNPYLFSLALFDQDRHRETVGVTGFHKFYNADSKHWVSVEDLRRGDHVPGVKGLLTVDAIDHTPGVERVYNMTVEHEHVYHVSALGALVHNVWCTRYHYTDKPESWFRTVRGFWRGSSVTDNPNLTAEEAQQLLGLARKPDKVIPITGNFVPNNPSVVQPSNRFTGGGADWTNPQMIPPSQIGPARPVQ
jgi:hypothetical protein